jgi:hypothetical protein
VRFSVWAGPWDQGYLDPKLRYRMSYAYHGGRLHLPRHATRRVYELDASAAYFDADLAKFGRLKPRVAGPRVTLDRPHAAWVVLCHNDALGAMHPDCCIRNQYGETYSYGLCPGHPDVQEYVIELCRQASRQPFVDELDVEALSFMGYAHEGLHEKTGVKLSPAELAELSECHCGRCGPDTLIRVLRQIRSVVDCRINLRVSLDPTFRGGKFPCSQEDLPKLQGLVDAITLTYFRLPVNFRRPDAPFEVHAGFVMHEPDCSTDADREARLAACSGADEVAFYCWGLAGADAAAWASRVAGNGTTVTK